MYKNKTVKIDLDKIPAIDKLNKIEFDPFFTILVRCWGHFVHSERSLPDEEQDSKNPLRNINRYDYPFIPLPITLVFRAFTILEHIDPKKRMNTRKYNNKFRFCDLGSGIGNILFLARYFWTLNYNQLVGVEKYERKNEIVEPKIRKDIINLTEEDLQSVDVIYLYHPIRDYKAMYEALSHVVKIAPAESIILFVNAGLNQSNITKSFSLRKGKIFHFNCFNYLYIEK
jgi:hypothetical protein